MSEQRPAELFQEVRGAADISTRCARCGAGFACGALDREHPCWCTEYPPVKPSADLAERCLCPRCLAAARR